MGQDPLMQWCLHLCHLCSSAHEVLRETGGENNHCRALCVTTPTYVHVARATAGFFHDVDTQLAETARTNSRPERAKHILLTMDEMHIQEDTVYYCNTGIYTCMCVYL